MQNSSSHNFLGSPHAFCFQVTLLTQCLGRCTSSDLPLEHYPDPLGITGDNPRIDRRENDFFFFNLLGREIIGVGEIQLQVLFQQDINIYTSSKTIDILL